MCHLNEDGTVYRSREHAHNADSLSQSVALHGSIIPQHSVSAQGISSATDTDSSGDGKLFARSRSSSRSNFTSSTISFESIIISNTSTLAVQFISPISGKKLYSYRDQLNLFRDALDLPMHHGGPFVPQPVYQPPANFDRRRYAEEIELEGPIYFCIEVSSDFEISLPDALHSRLKRLQRQDQEVLEAYGPSVSIRLLWPGYRPWGRQIPTRDFRPPPGPITLLYLSIGTRPDITYSV